MQTPTDVLVLHAVRTLGYASASRIAARLCLDESTVSEHLLDAESVGWVGKSAFGGDSGWSMTEAGKRHGESVLAAELDATGARSVVEAVHRDFLPYNESVSATCTAWQLSEGDPDGGRVDVRAIVDSLEESAQALSGFEARLVTHLARFAGYHARFADAVSRSTAEPAWIAGIDRDSCHRVWFELHEDLIATLGLHR